MAEEQVVDTDVGGAEPAPPPPMNERPVDGPGSGRSEIRKQLERGFEDDRKRQEPPRERAPKSRQVSRAREEGIAPDPGTGAEAAAEGEVADTDVAEAETKAPEGWSAEAKATWAELPPEVQAAVAKREVDTAKGVEALKAKYGELDQVLQPRMDVIRRHGHTPAQAVNQLFAWFEALSGNPLVAFPALANSFRFDLRSIPGLMQAQQNVAPPGQTLSGITPAPGEDQPEQVSQVTQQYIDSINQKLTQLEQGFSQQIGQLSNSFAAQSQAKTEEILSSWSKDKPHFEDVRRMMAHLLSSGAVAPLPNGNADLDRAYDMALYAVPEVRAAVLAEQAAKADAERKAKVAAEKKAQQDLADKARRTAAGSLPAGTPGAPVPPAKGKKGKSVAESLREAMQEIAENRS